MSIDNFIPFSKPDITEKEISSVVDALKSGWLTTGTIARSFEAEFGAYIGDETLECVAVNSATAALHLAVEAIGITVGDEVIVPTWTFTSSAEVVRYVGANPVFVDIDPDTFGIDLADAESKITSRTKAIIPVHFAGLPVSRIDLNNFCKRHNLRMVEDAAHSFPTKNDGRLIGNIGIDDLSDAVCFSFYATKTMTTGEGGMLVTRNKDLAERARIMRLHGISRDVFDRYTSKSSSWYYEVVAPGFKYNLTDLAAAIGRVQLERIDSMTNRRRQIAEYYLSEFADLPVYLPAVEREPGGHSWHIFALRIADEAKVNRDEFVLKMLESGIGCSMHFIPLHLQPYYRDTYGYKGDDLPNALANYQREVSIPLFSAQTEAEVERVVTTTRSLLS